MAKVLILYYSSFGHIETMARAVAEGAESAQAEVKIMRVPETVPEKIAESSGFKVNLDHAEAAPDELADYDAIVCGTPTNYGTSHHR
jgi:NAD(P)H dehydrogenase (quinone)